MWDINKRQFEWKWVNDIASFSPFWMTNRDFIKILFPTPQDILPL